MSMMGHAPSKSEIGETVATFPDYEGAQQAVTKLINAEVAPRDIAIVGSGLRSVERVTAKLGLAQAFRSGLTQGLFFGIFAAMITAIMNTEAPPAVYFGVVLVGIALGMLMSFFSLQLLKRRRSFMSATGVLADHYDVTVQASSIHKAREVMNKISPQRTRPVRPIDNTPPQYGERLPSYGERTAQAHPTQSDDTTP